LTYLADSGFIFGPAQNLIDWSYSKICIRARCSRCWQCYSVWEKKYRPSSTLVFVRV